MIEQPLEPLNIAIAVAIMAIGSALQASVGIGLALVVVPILALVDQSFIPGPMLLAGVMLALMTAYRERTAIDMPALRSSLIGLAIGTIVGAFFHSSSYLAPISTRPLEGSFYWRFCSACQATNSMPHVVRLYLPVLLRV
jgi:uncharacterized membrane protein YfcA